MSKSSLSASEGLTTPHVGAGRDSDVSARAILDASMRERDLQQLVNDAARLVTPFVYHPLHSRGSTPGWPDTAIILGRTLHFWELKTTSGLVTPDQRAWITALAQVERVDVALIRPCNWDYVEAVLKGGR